jgi:hypothetical protein
MSNKTGTTALQDIVALQSKIAAADTSLSNLENVLGEKEQALSALQPADSILPKLVLQRENILAAMVTGQANQTDLEKIDRAISAEQLKNNKSNGSNAGLIADTTQTIAGLKRKYEEEKNALAEMEFSRYHAVTDYLISEAEQIGTEYLLAAREVATLHRRLLALDSIINHRQQGATINKNRPVKLVIPVFNLTTHNGAESTITAGELDEAVNTYRVTNPLDIATQAERARIQNNGVNL